MLVGTLTNILAKKFLGRKFIPRFAKYLIKFPDYKWYSILCDEVLDGAGKQQASIVLRFVDSSGIIREDFVDFFTVAWITGEILTAMIREALDKYGLNLGDCRGQGYDGATNMSGVSGVQGRIIVDNPKATYQFPCT